MGKERRCEGGGERAADRVVVVESWYRQCSGTISEKEVSPYLHEDGRGAYRRGVMRPRVTDD
jgi:hypothetical protein